MEGLGNYAARLQITFTIAINANLLASSNCKRPPSIRVSGPLRARAAFRRNTKWRL